MSLDFDKTEVFAPLRGFTLNLLRKYKLLDSPDPTLANGWNVGDSFGSPVRVKKVPFQTIFGQIIASCPEGVTLFGVKRTIYAIQFVADRATYGLEDINKKWLGIFITRNIVVMYNPITHAVKRTIVSSTGLYMYKAEQSGNTALSMFLTFHFQTRPSIQPINESHPVLSVMRTGLGTVRKKRGPL